MSEALAGHMATEESPYHTALLQLAETAVNASGGACQLRVEADGVLGDERELLAKLQTGELAAMVGTATAIGELCPAASVCDFPMLFTDRAHFYRAADTVLQEKFAAALLPHGVRLLGILDGGWRDLYNSRHPIRRPEDLKGLRMRIMDNPIQRETYETLGAEAVVLSTHESYDALARRDVDGGDRAPSNFVEYGYSEMARYYTCIGLSVVAAYLLVSEAWFQAQGQAVRQALTAQGSGISRQARLLYQQRDAAAFERMRRDPRLQIVPEVDRSAFQCVLKRVWEKHLPQVGGEDLLQAVIQA